MASKMFEKSQLGKSRLIYRRLHVRVKQIMEEAVTRKFVHEDSSHIIALCGFSIFKIGIATYPFYDGCEDGLRV
ncbi:Small G protein signaling modulator 2 [Chelonia mydas]|uniref:Small G protein signaling modulator 2 n=1 Tax=Chelonia mydas TaxID=8469 RepID=M7BPP4_CHEMY|nr:Small G protein signaling modulator 2 [Chelonia mydas]